MQTLVLFIGTTELLLIGGMALLLFGGKKLPEMMRGLGKGVREFKKGINENEDGNEESSNVGVTDDGVQNQNELESENNNVTKQDVKGE